jgi:hypothetical protein
MLFLALLLAMMPSFSAPVWANCPESSTSTPGGVYTVTLESGYPQYNGNLVTFKYTVCKNGTGPNFKDLSHWILELDECIPCDAVVGGTGGSLKCGLDPTTGLYGVKFDGVGGANANGCWTFTLILDQSKVPGGAISVGSIDYSLKAGQNVHTGQICGPACCSIKVSAKIKAGPDCGGNVTLEAQVENASGDVTYEWFDGATPIGSTNPLNIKLAPGTHSITVRVTDAADCSAVSNPAINITVNQPVGAGLSLKDAANCDGVLTFEATGSGGTGSYTYTFYVDNEQKQSGTSNSFKYGPVLDGKCHTIRVVIKDSADPLECTASAEKTVTQCVTTTECP